MAYTPKTWVCGETITADGLNNIEDGIQEALECCGSGGDCGYSCTEIRETAFEGSLTTSSMGQMNGATFTPSQPIEGDSIAVTLNGTEYELPKVTVPFGVGYGDFDANSNPVFTNYPCAIGINQGQYYFFTQSEGTYQVAIYGMVLTAEITDCFEKAVIKAMGKPLKYVKDDASDHGGVIENAIKGTEVDGALVLYGNTASGNFSHAEGYATKALNRASHAEGNYTTSNGEASHAEGDHTTSNGEASHAEGYDTEARGDYSHAQNYQTTAQGYAQTAIGKYNIAQGNSSSANATDYAFIIGNGTEGSASNAFAIKWDGTFVFANGTEITPAQFASLLAML